MQHEHRCSSARGEDVSFRDVKIKIPYKMWPWDVNDVMHRKRARRIRGIWKKSVSWVFASEEDGWHSELAEALWRVPHVVVVVGGVGRWKSLHRKIVYLSPYVEKPFNSKVIKSFVPELRSRKCSSCFGIPMLSIYELWTFYVHFTYPCMSMLHEDRYRKTLINEFSCFAIIWFYTWKILWYCTPF